MEFRRTKIVATLGPASDAPGVLEAMLWAGVNVCRLNFSHGEAADHLRRAREVRAIAEAHGLMIAILADLQGPKIRVARFSDGPVTLNAGQPFALDAACPRDAGSTSVVGLDYPNLAKDCAPGDVLLLDDGRIVLRVTQADGGRIETEVVQGGVLSNHKGINKQGGGLSAPALTDKDYADMETVAQIDADYVAISFPRDAADMTLAREALRARGSDAALVAKIERAEAVSDAAGLDQLIEASDAVMVARGDLGVEIGDDRLIGVQKTIIQRARALDRPVITATQMMESMIHNAMPTRAEVFDVANAVLDGTDAVMLSAETAAGDYPVEVVKAMAKTAIGAEKTAEARALGARVDTQYGRRDEAIAMGAMYLANHLNDLAAIICITDSGSTPLWMSRSGSARPIVALSHQAKTRTRMALYRGVLPLPFEPPTGEAMTHLDQMVVTQVADALGLDDQDQVILTRGSRLNLPGGTSVLRIIRVAEAREVVQ